MRGWGSANDILQQPLLAIRKQAHDLEGLLTHFRKYKNIRKPLVVQVEDSFENSFRFGCGIGYSVITIDAGSRNHVTYMQYIGSNGFKVPSFLILKGQSVLPFITALTHSDRCYSDDDKALVWLKAAAQAFGVWWLVCMDGHGSHMTYEFLEYAKSIRTLLFAFLPHSTHLLQTLHIKSFQPFKYNDVKGLDLAFRAGQSTFSKTEPYSPLLQFLRPGKTQASILTK